MSRPKQQFAPSRQQAIDDDVEAQLRIHRGKLRQATQARENSIPRVSTHTVLGVDLPDTSSKRLQKALQLSDDEHVHSVWSFEGKFNPLLVGKSAVVGVTTRRFFKMEQGNVEFAMLTNCSHAEFMPTRLFKWDKVALKRGKRTVDTFGIFHAKAAKYLVRIANNLIEQAKAATEQKKQQRKQALEQLKMRQEPPKVKEKVRVVHVHMPAAPPRAPTEPEKIPNGQERTRTPTPPPAYDEGASDSEQQQQRGGDENAEPATQLKERLLQIRQRSAELDILSEKFDMLQLQAALNEGKVQRINELRQLSGDAFKVMYKIDQILVGDLRESAGRDLVKSKRKAVVMKATQLVNEIEAMHKSLSLPSKDSKQSSEPTPPGSNTTNMQSSTATAPSTHLGAALHTPVTAPLTQPVVVGSGSEQDESASESSDAPVPPPVPPRPSNR